MGQAGVRAAPLALAFKVVVPANFPKDKIWWDGHGQRRHAEGVWIAVAGVGIDQGHDPASRGSHARLISTSRQRAPRVVNPPAEAGGDRGQPLSLTLSVEDDGNPRPRVDRGAHVAGLKGAPAERPLNDSLRVSWVQWRGPGVAAFTPRVIRVVDGKAETKITFDKPGNYVLRAYAEDASIHTPHDVSVTVSPARQPDH